MKNLFFLIFIPIISIMATKQELLLQMQRDIKNLDILLEAYPNLKTKFAAQLAIVEALRGVGIEKAEDVEDDVPKAQFVKKYKAWIDSLVSTLQTIKDKNTDILVSVELVSTGITKFLSDQETNPAIASIRTDLTEALNLKGEAKVVDICNNLMTTALKIKNNGGDYFDNFISKYNPKPNATEEIKQNAVFSIELVGFPDCGALEEIITRKAAAEQAAEQAKESVTKEDYKNLLYNAFVHVTTDSILEIYKQEESILVLAKETKEYLKETFKIYDDCFLEDIGEELAKSVGQEATPSAGKVITAIQDVLSKYCNKEIIAKGYAEENYRKIKLSSFSLIVKDFYVTIRNSIKYESKKNGQPNKLDFLKELAAWEESFAGIVQASAPENTYLIDLDDWCLVLESETNQLLKSFCETIIKQAESILISL